MLKMAECVGFTSHKGGTGKTTSCLSIAGYLAKGGRNVLIVDFDPQTYRAKNYLLTSPC